MEDHQTHSSAPKDLLSSIPSKQAFWIGFVAAILCLGTLGFIILGSQMLGGGSFDLGAKAKAAPIVDNANLNDGSDAPTGAVPAVSKDDHIRGDENAPVTIIEYSDFECPFCSQFHPTMLEVMKNYDGKVKWIFRHFPLSFHPSAQPAANASECAAEQGKFWEFADQLFANQDSLGDEFYKKVAGDLKLNMNQFNTCLTSGKYKDKVATQAQDGASAGVSGTPGSFVIGKNGSATPIRGALPYESIKSAIDAALAQ